MATRPIDEKIVAMKMDNSDFVKKASDTTKLMGKFTDVLNKIPGINIGNTTKEFQNIQKSVNGIDTSRLTTGIETVTSRFSTMGVVATTALVNITNKVVNLGLQMLRSFTVAPVMDGFREYETKIGSIQTILANTSKYGTDVNDVTKALQELNVYADKTIYNFGDMTKNIGLFTNAGLRLEESTSMIKGFANAAASSGANAEKMANAAYQLSQGLSSGYIMQMDWMSLTNAGMGNDNMKRDLIALAHAMGTLKTSTEKTMSTWKESLSDDKWLTKEVFSAYLQAMAGDLDKAKLKTIGLTEAQADLLLANAKTGEEAATKVRTFTQMVGTITESIGSGWAESWEIIFGGFRDATKLWTGFTELISAPFASMTESRNSFLHTLKDAGVFKELFTTIGTVIYVIGQAIGAVTGGFDKAFSSDRFNMVSSLVKGFGNLVAALTPSQASLDKISIIFQALGSTVRVVMKILGEVGGLFLKLIPDNLGANILSIFANLAKMVIAFNESILKSNGLSGAFENLGSVFSWVGDRIGDVVAGLANAGQRISDIWNILTTGQEAASSSVSKDSTIVVWLTAIGKAAKFVTEKISNLNVTLTPVFKTFNSFFSAVATGFDWFREKVTGIGSAIRDNMPNGTTLLAGGFVASLIAVTGLVIKRVNDISKIFGGWGKTIQSFAETLDSVSGALDSFALNLKANALLTASIAVGALAVSILLLSRIDGSKIGTSLTAIVGSLSAVIGALAIMSKYDITGGLRTTTSIVGIALALSVMTIAIRQFGAMDTQQLTKGLIGVVVVLGAVAGAMALMGHFNEEKLAVSAAQIVAISLSIMILAKAIKTLGNMESGELAKGIGALAATLLALSSAFALMGKFGAKGSSASAMQFVAIAGSVIILVGAIKLISSIKTADLLTGLGTITAILAAIAGFAKLTSGTGLLASAAGLLAISIAMNALLVPIFALGNFPVDTLIVGLLGMSAALLAIAVASKLMNGSLVGAASVIAMAVALNMLIVPIGFFAALGWKPMLVGVAGLALSLGALAGVSLLLSPATVPLLGFSAAIGVMGLAMLAAGAGMSLFATGIVALAGMTSAAVVTLIATLGALITGLVSLIPSAVKMVISILEQMLTAVRDHAPKLIGLIVETIIGAIETISSYIPKFVEVVVKLVTNLLDALAKEAPKLIDSVVNLLITLVETMARTVEENGPRFVNAVLDLVKSILVIMVKAGTAVIKAMFGWIPGVTDAMNKVATSAEDAITEALDTAKIGEVKGGEFAEGLKSQQSVVRLAGETLSVSADEGLQTANVKTTGESFASDFASGMLNRKLEVKNASTLLAGAASDGFRERLDINSPSGEGIEEGEYYGDGHVIGINNSAPKVEQAAKNMAEGAMSGVKGTYGKVKDMLFLSDEEVAENDKQSKKVSDTYSDVGKSKVESDKKAAKSAEQIRKEEFDKSKQWIDDRKYYNQLSLTQELAAWQRLQKKYLKGTEERRQADREVYRVEQEIIKQKEDAQKQWIDDQKYYNKLTLAEELAAWKRIQKEHKKGTEQRKQADREVYRVEQELIKQKSEAQKEAFDKSKEWISDEKEFKHMSLTQELIAWERVQKRYKEGSEERKNADREVLRVKNEINQRLIDIDNDYLQKVTDTNQALIEQEKQLNDEYQRTYDDRVKSISNFVGLFDEIRKQDAENPITGQQLLTNLQDQTNALATWSDDLKRLAQKGIDEGLLKELEEMGPSAALEIAALNDLTSAQLDQYVGLWQQKNALAKTQAAKELESLRKDTDTQIEQLKTDTAKQLDEYKSEWIKKIAEIRVGTTDGFVGLNDDMNSIGADAIEGLTKGLADQEGPLYDKVKEIAQGIESTIKQTLKIKSPSRVLMALGQFAGQGLANGLGNMSKTVAQKSKDLATTAVSSANEFLSMFQQPSFDNEIHLRAVLDASDVNSKLSGLGNAPALNLGTTNSLVSSTKAALRQNGSNVPTTNATPVATNSPSTPDSNRPIVIQSILNGRVIAEETFNDINQLMGFRTNLDYAMRGV